MDGDKLKWCVEQKKGISLIELNPHLSEAYMKEADETLENVFSTKGKWKVITAYYACYNALYSLLMKAGLKCEIHDCTVELTGLFGFEDGDIGYLKSLKKDRIDTQYHLKDIKLDDEAAVKKFVLKCKTLLNGLDSEKIEKIREKINSIK